MTAVSGTMSAILSADDLNDFISPGVACIKPVETLPEKAPQDSEVCFALFVSSNERTLILHLICRTRMK